MSSLAWGDTFKNFLNEVGAGEAEDVLKEYGIESVDDLVRRSMDDLPLSEELQKRLSLGISIESHRRALRERARRHAADSTSPTHSPQPVGFLPESPASHQLHPVGSPSMVPHFSMEDSFEEELAALREAKEAGDISILEYATALAQLRRKQQMALARVLDFGWRRWRRLRTLSLRNLWSLTDQGWRGATFSVIFSMRSGQLRQRA